MQNKQITTKQILSHFQMETDKSPKEIGDPEIQRELLILEGIDSLYKMC